MARLSASPHKRPIELQCIPVAPLELAIPEHTDQPQHSTLPPSRRDSLLSSSSPTATVPSFKGSEQGPLVLLHITLLPLPEPWLSGQLSSGTEKRVHLLHAQLAPEICARGVLIQHPGPDFGLLEERIIDAIGLSAVETSEDDTPVENIWDVRVFAASGLMTSVSWAVAWEEMERIDVAITPSVTEEERLAMQQPTPRRCLDIVSLETRVSELEKGARSLRKVQSRNIEKASSPQVQAEQIPLDVLLRNYLYLLAKDIRNLIIAVLLLTLFATGFWSRSGTGTARVDACDVFAQTLVDTFSSIQATNLAAMETIRRAEPDDTQKAFPAPPRYLTVMVQPGEAPIVDPPLTLSALNESTGVEHKMANVGTALIEYEPSQGDL